MIFANLLIFYLKNKEGTLFWFCDLIDPEGLKSKFDKSRRVSKLFSKFWKTLTSAQTKFEKRKTVKLRRGKWFIEQSARNHDF